MNSNKNLTNNYNPQSIQAKVIYFLKNRIITTEQFLLSSTFNSVLEYFKKNIKSESNIKLKKEYIYNNKKIDINESLINIIEIKKNSSSSIESIEIFIELEEAKNNNYNINNNGQPIFQKLIQPKENPFGLYVFNIKEGIITLEQYSPEIIKKYELNKFNKNYSAYCNSPKHLYISGGKMNNNISLNDFLIINNKKYSIIQKKMPYKKSNHSMIYIYLNNKEYIFIAGGDNNLITFYYDINMSSFIIWSNMNSLNVKPSLYQYKEYLYSFQSFNNVNNNIFFERTNLVYGKPYWEKIVPKFDDINYLKLNFKSKNFGISKGNSDEILFVGGEDADKNITIYDPDKNILEFNKDIKNIKVKLSDKNFYNINKEHNIALPSSLSYKKQIAVVNMVKQSIRLINFELTNGASKVQLINDEKEIIENNIGNVFVKIKIGERKRFDIQPQIVEEQKLFFEKKEDNNDKEIIKVEFIPNLNKEEGNKNKINRKKNRFYLSNDSVYNNFVNLIVEKLKNKK